MTHIRDGIGYQSIDDRSLLIALIVLHGVLQGLLSAFFSGLTLIFASFALTLVVAGTAIKSTKNTSRSRQ